MRKIAKSELNSLFAAIAERAKLYGAAGYGRRSKVFRVEKREKVFRSFEHCSQCKRLFLSADRKPDGTSN